MMTPDDDKTLPEESIPLYLARSRGGTIYVCDDNGRIVRGLTRVVVENGTREITEVTICFYPEGWLDGDSA